jgi:dihydrodipicolinate synthase/N-acetylneuraminate lyase
VASLERQLDYLHEHVSGFLVGGSLGEVASLTIEEREALIRTCAGHQNERLSIDKVAALKGETDFVVWAGDDSVLWHQLSRGADGAMVALPMIYPE